MAIAKMRLIDMARTLNERSVETPGDYYRRKHPGVQSMPMHQLRPVGIIII